MKSHTRKLSPRNVMKKISSNGRDPGWWLKIYRNTIMEMKNSMKNCSSFLDKEWDFLIVLDACRHDLFESRFYSMNKIPFSHSFSYTESRGSHTNEFLRDNFYGADRKTLESIIYITANPQVDRFLGKSVKICPVWLNGWSDEHGTVTPESMYFHTLETIKKHREYGKRFIIHFMQPHSPFIGGGLDVKDTRGAKLREHVMNRRVVDEGKCVWDLLEEGSLSRKDVIEAYKKNLDVVSPYVMRLLNVLGGTIVVTSDHGNCIGERMSVFAPFKVYGHPERCRMKPLVKVPWLEVRKDVKTDYTAIEKELIRMRLSGLKY